MTFTRGVGFGFLIKLLEKYFIEPILVPRSSYSLFVPYGIKRQDF